MEATPPAEPRLADGPSPAAPDKAGGGLRAVGVLGFLVLGIAAAVVAAVMVDIGNGPLCDAVQPTPGHPSSAGT